MGGGDLTSDQSESVPVYASAKESPLGRALRTMGVRLKNIRFVKSLVSAVDRYGISRVAPQPGVEVREVNKIMRARKALTQSTRRYMALIVAWGLVACAVAYVSLHLIATGSAVGPFVAAAGARATSLQRAVFHSQELLLAGAQNLSAPMRRALADAADARAATLAAVGNTSAFHFRLTQEGGGLSQGQLDLLYASGCVAAADILAPRCTTPPLLGALQRNGLDGFLSFALEEALELADGATLPTADARSYARLMAAFDGGLSEQLAASTALYLRDSEWFGRVDLALQAAALALLGGALGLCEATLFRPFLRNLIFEASRSASLLCMMPGYIKVDQLIMMADG